MAITIDLYGTVSPMVMKQNERQLSFIAVGLPPAESNEYLLRVDDYGHFSYRHHGKIKAMKPIQPFPEFELQAKVVAEKFFARVNLATSKLPNTPFQSLFPMGLFLREVELFRNDGGIVLATLRYAIRLHGLKSEPSIEVNGASIDVSIGTNMEVLAFSCNWRPITNSRPTNLHPVLFDSKLALPNQGHEKDLSWISVNGQLIQLKMSIHYEYNPNELLICPFYLIDGKGVYGNHEIPASNESFFCGDQMR